MLEGAENERDMPGEAEDPPEEDAAGLCSSGRGCEGAMRRVTVHEASS